MTLKIEINCDNAAFEDAIASESARILRSIANRMEGGTLPEDIHVRDINGNRVGKVEVEL